jgi:hypothetical protein
MSRLRHLLASSGNWFVPVAEKADGKDGAVYTNGRCKLEGLRISDAKKNVVFPSNDSVLQSSDALSSVYSCCDIWVGRL